MHLDTIHNIGCYAAIEEISDKSYYDVAVAKIKGYSQQCIEKKENGQLDIFDLMEG
jgi:hypothetical protein